MNRPKKGKYFQQQPKGGCVGLDEFWKQHPEFDPPKLLPNCDNAATISKAAGTEAVD
ncbi:hypothetical protein EV359DRAFT_87927 [Lentinula novae-zelandiae]|nr:hypothetical protein EV359DRAFT_87927 [Lentinula novae-zelandiae]